MASEGHHWSTFRRAESQITRKVKSVWSDFIGFALRDNVLEVAVGLIIASTFTAIVNSLVSDIILPPISLLPFMSRNLEEKFWVLKKGEHYSDLNGYTTRKQAIGDGAVIMTYGAFFDKTLNFVGIGVALYVIANVYGYFSKDSIIKHVVKCPYCRKDISQKARRCPMCTSWQDGREDAETTVLPPREE